MHFGATVVGQHTAQDLGAWVNEPLVHGEYVDNPNGVADYFAPTYGNLVWFDTSQCSYSDSIYTRHLIRKLLTEMMAHAFDHTSYSDAAKAYDHFLRQSSSIIYPIDYGTIGNVNFAVMDAATRRDAGEMWDFFHVNTQAGTKALQALGMDCTREQYLAIRGVWTTPLLIDLTTSQSWSSNDFNPHSWATFYRGFLQQFMPEEHIAIYHCHN